MSISNYNYLKGRFTHDKVFMGNFCHYLPMTSISCIENSQNLYMTTTTCKGNTTFLNTKNEHVEILNFE